MKKFLTIVIFAFFAYNADLMAQCKPKPILKQHKASVKPYNMDAYMDNELLFSKEPKQIETPFTAYSGDSYKLVFAVDNCPQEFTIAVYDRNKKAKTRKELYSKTIKPGELTTEPFEIKKPGNYYIQFNIPASSDQTLKKMCLITMIGYMENE